MLIFLYTENGVTNTSMDLDSMNYSELRTLAKKLGLKANGKADKLIKAIKEHYQHEKETKEGGQEDCANAAQDENVTKDSAQDNNEATCKDEVLSPTVFVNTRRGKRKGTKRRISDTATVTEHDAAEAGVEVAVTSARCGVRGAKNRKMSPTMDSEDNQTRAVVSEPQQPDMKVEMPLQGDTDKPSKAVKPGKIPRYQGVQSKNKPLLKPVTPNFKKLHEAHFNKMESIDSYVQRKTKQMETHRGSVKELKKLSDKTKLQQEERKTQVKANRASILSPIPLKVSAAEKKPRRSSVSASKAPPNKPAGKEDAPFRPSVLSVRRINVRFSEATHDNEYKRSMVKTPARMSPCVTSSTPLKQTTDGGKPSDVKTALSATKTPAPIFFSGNTSTSTPGTQKKTTFDLKASLSRPLTYKPYTGKLKPFGETKENTAANKSLISVSSHQKKYKQHQVQTRDDRRVKQVEDRKQKKERMLGARRGLVMM